MGQHRSKANPNSRTHLESLRITVRVFPPDGDAYAEWRYKLSKRLESDKLLAKAMSSLDLPKLYGSTLGVAVAYKSGRVVGFFFFHKDKSALHASGTVVKQKYQKLGIGTKLWDAVLYKLRPPCVKVFTISKGGAKLVGSIRDKYKRIGLPVRFDHVSS